MRSDTVECLDLLIALQICVFLRWTDGGDMLLGDIETIALYNQSW